ncbi:MAG: transposase [Gemmatimonadaceae bacterium]
MSHDNGRKRRQFTPDEKATILRRHLSDKVPVSDLCDEYRIQPSLFYVWQKQAMDNLGAAFQDGRSRHGRERAAASERERIAALEARLLRKDGVIAQVSEEYLALKKKLGES